jgi:hypothetical protein
MRRVFSSPAAPVDIKLACGLSFQMELGAKLALVSGLFNLSFMLNLPMGFLRGKTRKYSLSWILCIHLSIPVIYLGRLFSGLDFRYIPIFLAAAVLGQIWGGKMEL